MAKAPTLQFRLEPIEQIPAGRAYVGRDVAGELAGRPNPTWDMRPGSVYVEPKRPSALRETDLVAVSIVAGLVGGLAGAIVFGLMATHAVY